MKTLKKRSGLLLVLALLLASATTFAQPSPPAGRELNSWSFTDTNWLSDRGYAPAGFTNLVNLSGGGDGSALLLDTTNTISAFLFYNVHETNGFTNIVYSKGSISLWFRPDWSSTNQGGTGPGDWGNLISVGQEGTNGPWWSWYISPDGCSVYFSSQTNGSSVSNYLVAPVSFLTTNWYNLALTYDNTGSAFYTNGVLVTNGTRVAYWPGTNVNFFSIGSDSNGVYQAGGAFDDLATYNYALDPDTISGTFGMYSIFYYGGGGGGDQLFTNNIVSAHSTNTVMPIFSAVTGAGFLTGTGASPAYATSSNIWLTNYSAAIVSSNVMMMNFAVAGGSNNVLYDVFATTALVSPITNGVWYWMGQAYRGTNYALPITNFPPSNIFLILGQPQDTDQDGLTDAYERLVTHTDPNNPDSGESGMLDGWAVIFGLNPNAVNSANTALRSNFSYDPVGRLDLLFGIRGETLTNDFEGNILLAH